MVRPWAALAVVVCAASDAPSRRLQQEPSDAAMRLIVLSGARTGSSLLIETLRRHADILMHGEIFHENDLRKSEKDGFDGGLKVGDDVFNKRHATPRVLLDFVAAHSLGRKVVGFKLFSEHLEWQKLPAFLDWASHVVVLQRTHMLAQYVSICVAQRNNDWVQHDERRRRTEPVALDVGNFESWRHREVAFAGEAARAAERLGGRAPRVLKINYRSKERDVLPSSLDEEAAACLRATQPNDVALVRAANDALDARGTDARHLEVFAAAKRAATAACREDPQADPQCSLLERAVAALNQKVPLPRHHQEAFSGKLCPSPKRPRGAVAPDESYAPAFRDGAARAAVADLDAALAAAPGRDVSASARVARWLSEVRAEKRARGRRPRPAD